MNEARGCARRPEVKGRRVKPGAGQRSPAYELSFSAPCYATDYLEAAQAGIIASNNSWGYTVGWTWNSTTGTWENTGANPSFFGYYSNFSADIDGAVRSADLAGDLLLVCFAAGNDRNDGIGGGAQHDGRYYPTDIYIANPYYDTISHSATGKNILTVGAVDGGNLSAEFSSIGPVDDYRIKPDLVAKGIYMHTTTLNESYYFPDVSHPWGWAGTSAATPVVVGASALLVGQFEATFGRRPTTAELKALMIQTCKDLGRAGPDYVYGFGLLDAQAAADLIRADGGAGRRILHDSVANANHDAFHFQSDGSPIRLTLTWIDAPGTANSAANDITNNLDIRLLSPSGVIHYPYRMRAGNPLAEAVNNAANSVDTVEQVVVLGLPETGTWQIEIKGTTVPVGPVQTYGLVSSHELEPGWFVDLQDMQVDYEVNGDVTLSWNPINSTAQPYVTGFRVLRRHLPNPWVVIADEAQLGPSAAGYLDTTSPSTGLVWYDVRAVINVAGEEVFSANPGGQTTRTPSILTPAEDASVPAATATTVAGVAEPDAVVTLFDNGTPIGSATAGSDGAWTLPGCIFGPAGTQRTLTAVAQQGNEGPSLPSFERHIDIN